ncbi:unnamed protein product, partial [Ixodes persulcatus]
MAAEAHALHACARCSQPIRGRSHYLPCASCKMRFHCKCINVQADEYNFFMESRNSKYKCNQCMKRRDPSTAELISEAGIASRHPRILRLFWNLQTLIIQLIQSMASRLEELTSEVRELRVENISLRDAVRDLRDCVCGSHCPNNSDCPASFTGSFASAVITGTSASRAGVPLPKFHARQKSPGRHQCTVVHRSSDPERQVQRPPTTVGTAILRLTLRWTKGKSYGPPDPITSHLKTVWYFTSMHVTEASDVQGLLARLVGEKTVVCTKLKTRYPTYSSFHVSLDKDLFELLNKPEVWPVGSVFRPFYGKLSP